MSANDKAEATYGRGQEPPTSFAADIAAVLTEHQQWVGSCGPEDECSCGASLSGYGRDDIATHQAEKVAPILSRINRQEIAEEVVRINQEAMLIRNRRAIDEELRRGPLEFERNKFDGSDQ